MGRPFNQELEEISGTIEAVSNSNNRKISESLGLVLRASTRTTYFVGSGGSLIACEFLSQLHHSTFNTGFVRTPYDILSNPNQVYQSHVVVISARGRNKDIINVIEASLRFGCSKISVIILSKGSLIHRKYLNNERISIYEFSALKKKDGFLSVNSIVAFSTIFMHAYGVEVPVINLDKTESILDFCEITKTSDDFFVLHNYWTRIVALDLESKFTEAALGNMKPTDYRNFGHGRHHWIAKRPSTAIIALSTPTDKLIQKKTIQLLPKDTHSLILESNYEGMEAVYELLNRSLYIVNYRGRIMGIDPGRPGVPEFGTKLYKVSAAVPKNQSLQSESIKRKLLANGISHPSMIIQEKWESHYNLFFERLTSTNFKALAFDYDGTICSSKRTYDGPDSHIQDQLIRLLNGGVTVSFATGRGGSIRVDLRKFIPKELWKNVMIGYYNGVQISNLSDDDTPYKNTEIDQSLKEVIDYITQIIPELTEVIQTQKNHLSIRHDQCGEYFVQVRRLLSSLVNSRRNSLRILESSHSIDIFSYDHSKLSVLELLNQKGIDMQNILTIGDRGVYPGNDFELLSIENSLSVDEVSPDPYSCWNLSNFNSSNSETLMSYLTSIKVLKSGWFILDL